MFCLCIMSIQCIECKSINIYSRSLYSNFQIYAATSSYLVLGNS